MRNRLIFVLAILMSLGLAGCGQGTSSAPQDQPSAAATDVKVDVKDVKTDAATAPAAPVSNDTSAAAAPVQANPTDLANSGIALPPAPTSVATAPVAVPATVPLAPTTVPVPTPAPVPSASPAAVPPAPVANVPPTVSEPTVAPATQSVPAVTVDKPAVSATPVVVNGMGDKAITSVTVPAVNAPAAADAKLPATPVMPAPTPADSVQAPTVVKNAAVVDVGTQPSPAPAAPVVSNQPSPVPAAPIVSNQPGQNNVATDVTPAAKPAQDNALPGPQPQAPADTLTTVPNADNGDVVDTGTDDNVVQD